MSEINDCLLFGQLLHAKNGPISCVIRYAADGADYPHCHFFVCLSTEMNGFAIALNAFPCSARAWSEHINL